MVKSRPHVILNAAMSLDGKITTRTGDSKLSSKTDKIRVHKLRASVDAILIGKNTVMQDNPLLTVRYAKGNNPIRIILDSKATISSKSRIITTCHTIPTIIITSKSASKKNLSRLQKFPLEVIVCGIKNIDIKKCLTLLAKRKINRILVEGGGTINWEFVKNHLIDEIMVTVTPFLLGGKESVTLVEGLGFSKITQSSKLKLKQVRKLKNEVVLHYT